MSRELNQETTNTDKYERSGGVEGRLLERFRERLVGEVAALNPGRILDAGCGEGIVAEWLREALPEAELVGVDGRAAALREFARRNPGVEALTADLYGLPFEEARFDLVMAIEVLEHIEQPAAVVGELARVSGGHLLLTVPHEPFFRAGNLARGRYVGRLGSTPGHVNTWGRRGFTRVLSRAADDVRWWSAFPWQGVTARTRDGG